MASERGWRLNCAIERDGNELLPPADVELAPGLNLVTGDNGSGKSSLLLGLAAPDELIAGHRLSPDIQAFRRQCLNRRLVSQDTRFQVIGPTLGHDLEITAQLRAEPAAALEAAMTAHWPLLPGFLPRRVGAVSRGELQRFVGAQSCSRPPSLLALDEPDGFLDEDGMNRLVEAVAAAARGPGGPSLILMTTHRRGEWERRLAGIALNHVGLPESRTAPGCTPAAANDSPVHPGAMLTRGMKVRIGRRTRRLSRNLELGSHRGTIVAGANGSGKTSLLRAIAGERSVARQCRFVPDWSADVGDVRTIAELGIKQGFADVLTGQRLEPNRPVACCSWGQRRILSMFEALSAARSFYIFDEPFAGLSQSMQRLVAAVLVDRIQAGAHVVLSSNRVDDPTAAMAGFDRIEIGEYLE